MLLLPNIEKFKSLSLNIAASQDVIVIRIDDNKYKIVKNRFGEKNKIINEKELKQLVDEVVRFYENNY
jgi:hypothetical protein